MREIFTNLRVKTTKSGTQPFFHTVALTPGFFGTVNLCNRNFTFPDSVPDTVMAGLDVRNILIV